MLSPGSLMYLHSSYAYWVWVWNVLFGGIISMMLLYDMPSLPFFIRWDQSLKSSFAHSGTLMELPFSKSMYFAFLIIWSKCLPSDIIDSVQFSLTSEVSRSFSLIWYLFNISMIPSVNLCNLYSGSLMIKRLVSNYQPIVIFSSSNLTSAMVMLNSKKSGIKMGFFIYRMIHSVDT